jgi:hypothetical protein
MLIPPAVEVTETLPGWVLPVLPELPELPAAPLPELALLWDPAGANRPPPPEPASASAGTASAAAQAHTMAAKCLFARRRITFGSGPSVACAYGVS